MHGLSWLFGGKKLKILLLLVICIVVLSPATALAKKPADKPDVENTAPGVLESVWSKVVDIFDRPENHDSAGSSHGPEYPPGIAKKMSPDAEPTPSPVTTGTADDSTATVPFLPVLDPPVFLPFDPSSGYGSLNPPSNMGDLPVISVVSPLQNITGAVPVKVTGASGTTETVTDQAELSAIKEADELVMQMQSTTHPSSNATHTPGKPGALSTADTKTAETTSAITKKPTAGKTLSFIKKNPYIARLIGWLPVCMLLATAIWGASVKLVRIL
ncbi:MAG: hypothetical protein ACYC56_05425 [Candidatus Aquicultor sp.]